MNSIIKKITAFTLAAAMLALTACSSTSDTSSNSSVVEDNTPKIVKTTMSSEPDSLNPWTSAATDTEAVFFNVFEGLVFFDSEGNIIPGIAESWDISEDGLTYTFKLKDNVVFHNGQKLTSADVMYTYENLSGISGEAASSQFTTITNLEAPDDYTFIITLGEVSAPFLAFNTVAVLPVGYDEHETHPIGTGPFKFVEYVPGQKVVLEKFEEYHSAGRMAKIDGAEVYIMSDSSAITAALRSGQLNVASVSSEDAEILKDQFNVYNSPQNMVQIFALNNEVAPYDDIRVRQAINYAINKQDIIDGIYGGYATELYSNFSPVMGAYYNDELSGYYKTDVEKAKELLAEAGLADGFNMKITVPANYQNHIDAAQVISQQLKAVNINVEIELIEWATWLEDVYRGFKYDTTIIGLTGKLDPNDVLKRYSSDYSLNFFRFANEEYDNLILEALVETDEVERAKIYKRCQEILTENAAAVYIADPNVTVLTDKTIKGYTFYPVGFKDFSSIYFE